MDLNTKLKTSHGLTRREFVLSLFTAGVYALAGTYLFKKHKRRTWKTETFISRVETYEADIASIIIAGMQELGVSPKEIKGKHILLKPNLVEPQANTLHINTHPLVVRSAAEAFFHMGANKVIVAEGSGHCRDTLRTLEASGMAEVLVKDKIPFVDLNCDEIYTLANKSRYSSLKTLTFPVALRQADWIVSMPKMKTHHWTGITLSMKNLFGIMPGMYYGWPKNVLHHAGIDQCILDIYSTIKPHFAIVDGIMGMEGDGPIMGSPRYASVLVMGRNFVAVDATCARIMEIDPEKVTYISAASHRLGPAQEKNICQFGEKIDAVRTPFALIDKIPSHRGLRLI